MESDQDTPAMADTPRDAGRQAATPNEPNRAHEEQGGRRTRQTLERWLPGGRKGETAPVNHGTIIVANDMSRDDDERPVDEHTAYRAMKKVGMADRLMRSPHYGETKNLNALPNNEHLVKITVRTDEGTGMQRLKTVTEEGPDRLMHAIEVELTLRRKDTPDRKLTLPVDIAYEQPYTGPTATCLGLLVTQEGTRNPTELAEATTEALYDYQAEEPTPARQRQRAEFHDDVMESLALVGGGEKLAAVTRAKQALTRHVAPHLPKGSGAWIEIDRNGQVRVALI